MVEVPCFVEACLQSPEYQVPEILKIYLNLAILSKNINNPAWLGLTEEEFKDWFCNRKTMTEIIKGYR